MTFELTCKMDWQVMITVMVNKDEGGWVLTNNPNDPGALTYAGMTYTKFIEGMKKYDESPSREGFISGGTLQTIALRDRIIQVYFDGFIVPLSLADLPGPAMYLSCAVNIGVVPCGKLLQMVGNYFGGSLTIDGVIGEKSKRTLIDVFNQRGVSAPQRKFMELWRKHYIDLVQANAEVWLIYAEALAELDPVTIVTKKETVDKLKPQFKRWRDLEGWIERVQRYA